MNKNRKQNKYLIENDDLTAELNSRRFSSHDSQIDSKNNRSNSITLELSSPHRDDSKSPLLERLYSLSRKQSYSDLKKEIVIKEHLEPIYDLIDRLHTDLYNGLNERSYNNAVTRFGSNVVTPPQTIPEWIKFIEHITGGFDMLLWVGGILCFISYFLQGNMNDVYLGIVLFALVLITGCFSYYQQRSSSELMKSFKELMAENATVIRNGKTSSVKADTLVPGDIILMKGGEKVPADVRIIECTDDMQVDNACLTGESEPCARSPKATHENPLEAENLAFFGTQIPKGEAKCVVIHTGDHTIMGRINKLTLATGTEDTPIARELDRFVKMISCIAATIGVLFFILGFFIQTPLLQNIVFMIGIIVANVPEGLLATVTVCLTLTANRMFLRNVLVKNLEAVETLGSTTCICSDKTGTLTQNIMTVTNLVYDNKVFNCECSFHDIDQTQKDDKCYKKLLRCCALCNNAKWDESSKYKFNDNGEKIYLPFTKEVKLGKITENRIQWKTIGDASESALLRYVQGVSGFTDDINEYRDRFPLIKEIPFNSQNKFQVCINSQHNKKNHLITMKGAPEKVLARCDKYYDRHGKILDLTDEIRELIMDNQLELSKIGLRVLGFAELELPSDDSEANQMNMSHPYTSDYQYNTLKPNFPLGEETIPIGYGNECIYPLHFIGLCAMIDPPRPQVPIAVDKCKAAGIRVIMVTGDHPATAKAIAKKVGIIWSETEDELYEINKKNGFYNSDKPRIEENGYREPSLADAIVVTGSQINLNTPDYVWDDILNHSQVVFARTSPQQKLLIVEHCQKREEIVAVTGDGVNDAPALRKADIGIAMGIMGSAVSKDAADMILLDDNFASIIEGVEQGRLIFDNLKKSIAYTLSSNVPEVFPFICYVLVGLPLPLDTITILCIDVGTDMVPAISFAWEKAESDIMRRPPRYAKEDKLVPRKLLFFSYLQIGIIMTLGAFTAYFFSLADYGYPMTQLFFSGSHNNWGRQTYYCSFTGGSFKNINGDIYPHMEEVEWGKGQETVDAVHAIYNQGYWFYDAGESLDYIDTCRFAAKNYEGLKSKFDDYERYYNVKGYTDGVIVPTDTSIQALYDRGMVEYIPFRSVRSTFWDNNWLSWDVENKNADGMGLEGEGFDDTLFYTYQPYGVYEVLSNEQSSTDAIKMKDATNGISYKNDKINPDKCFSYASLSQGIFSEENIYQFPFNTVKKDGKILLNIASRMCQKEALANAQTSFFVAVVVQQIANALITKSRMAGLHQQGVSNSAMNFGFVFELLLAMMLCYIDGLNYNFGTRPIRVLHWLGAVPFFIFIMLYDEIRKFIMRKTVVLYEDKVTHQIIREASWIERNTYY